MIERDHINELRGEANELLDLIRKSTGLRRRLLRDQLAMKRLVIEIMLKNWWEQEGM